MLCVGGLLAIGLHEEGFSWWQNITLTGYVVFLTPVLISLFLFALFRGIGSTQQITAEHPLTSTAQYMGFYVAAPLLGGLAGVLGMIGISDTMTFLLGLARGTLYVTFAVWVVLDPIVGSVELVLPGPRKHRAERLAQAEAERRARAERRERLLTEAVAREEQERHRWETRLQGEAERLASLLATNASDFDRVEKEALDIGASAWRLGGLTCMQQLRDMAIHLVEQRRKPDDPVVDYISYWWDGIGDWRRPSFG